MRPRFLGIVTQHGISYNSFSFFFVWTMQAQARVEVEMMVDPMSTLQKELVMEIRPMQQSAEKMSEEIYAGQQRHQ